MTGRPSSLTPETQEAILEAIRAGNYKATACAKAGIHRDTLHGWEQRAAKGEEPYATFAAKLTQAEAEGETRLIDEIRGAQGGVSGPGGHAADVWQARAWILERRWPKRWAARVRQAVTEELDAFTDRLQRRLDDATYRKVLDASREDAPGEGAEPRH